MVVINKQKSLFQKKPWLFVTFFKAVGKCNQVIYEETIAELCCPPLRDAFDDNSMFSDSTASETGRDDIDDHRVVIVGTTSVAPPTNAEFDMTSVGAIRGRVNGVCNPTLDDRPRDLTNIRRSRSMRRSGSAGPDKMSRSCGRSRSMSRGTTMKHREEPPATSKAAGATSALSARTGGKSSKNKSKETKNKHMTPPAVLDEGHPMTRKESRRHENSSGEANPSMEEDVMAREHEVSNEESAIGKSIERYLVSRTDGAGGRRGLEKSRGKELTRGSSPKGRSRSISSRRTSSPRRVASPPIRRSASTPRRSRTPQRQGSGTNHREEPPATSKTARAISVLIAKTGVKSFINKSMAAIGKNTPTRAVLEEGHPMTKNRSRRHKRSGSSSSKKEKWAFEASRLEEVDDTTCDYEVMNEGSKIAKSIKRPSNGSMFVVPNVSGAGGRRRLTTF
jgi:hypothetical protein